MGQASWPKRIYYEKTEKGKGLFYDAVAGKASDCIINKKKKERMFYFWGFCGTLGG